MSLRSALAICFFMMTASALTGCAVLSSSRQPATATLNLNVVCAGPADSEDVFSFSSQPGKLKTHFTQDGTAVITGEALVTLRSRGDTSDFEGEVAITGTRSKDGYLYALQTYRLGTGETWFFDLPWKGTGEVRRLKMVGTRPEKLHTYNANCMEAF